MGYAYIDKPEATHVYGTLEYVFLLYECEREEKDDDDGEAKVTARVFRSCEPAPGELELRRSQTSRV